MAAANSETPDMPLDAQWSPDSTRILSYRLLRNGTYIWHTVQQNPPGSRFPREFSFVYPTAGAKDVPREEPIVIDVAATLKQVHPVINDLKVPAVDVLYPGDPDLGWDGSRTALLVALAVLAGTVGLTAWFLVLMRRAAGRGGTSG